MIVYIILITAYVYVMYRYIYLCLSLRKPLPFFHYASLVILCGKLKLYDVGAAFKVS